MPWHIAKGGGTCGESQWAVLKDDDGSTAGCHDSQGEAEAQLAALYASERTAMTDERAAAAEARREAMQARTDRPRLSERQPGAQGRAEASGDQPATLHDRYLAFPAQIRTDLTERDGKSFFRVEGYASVFEQPYDMWDTFGPYNEVVSRTAADDTLAAQPDVAFLINHRGLSLARTAGPWNDNHGTLDLSADEHGLRDVAWLNPERSEVKNLRLAIDDKIVTEQSFAFMIDDGEWSEDFTTYRIGRFDLNRGDVSAVNYGANPYTTIAARQQEILTDLRMAGPGMARAMLSTLLQRADVNIDDVARRFVESAPPELDRSAAAKGRSVNYWQAVLLEDE